MRTKVASSVWSIVEDYAGPVMFFATREDAEKAIKDEEEFPSYIGYHVAEMPIYTVI